MQNFEPVTIENNAKANPEEGGTDRRRSPRQRALKGALIVFNGGHCTMGCHILNASKSGARLMPADVMLCPSEFVLKPRIGPERNCEVVWRKATTIGVKYF